MVKNTESGDSRRLAWRMQLGTWVGCRHRLGEPSTIQQRLIYNGTDKPTFLKVEAGSAEDIRSSPNFSVCKAMP
jgi:hypothetical protein